MYSELIHTAWQDSAKNLCEFFISSDNKQTMKAIMNIVIDTINQDGKIMSCGNGGSMCQAMHFAEELSGRFRKDRKALPAIALSDVGHMTCVANDYGYQFVFSRMIEALGKPDDVLVCFSTSGNSSNIMEAAKIAHDKDMVVIGILGRDGGKVLKHCDLALLAPGATSDRIQEVHLLILHLLVEMIEMKLVSCP